MRIIQNSRKENNMNKNEYKVNTYVLIKNGEIYEIDEEGCVK